MNAFGLAVDSHEHIRQHATDCANHHDHWRVLRCQLQYAEEYGNGTQRIEHRDSNSERIFWMVHLSPVDELIAVGNGIKNVVAHHGSKKTKQRAARVLCNKHAGRSVSGEGHNVRVMKYASCHEEGWTMP